MVYGVALTGLWQGGCAAPEPPESPRETSQATTAAPTPRRPTTCGVVGPDEDFGDFPAPTLGAGMIAAELEVTGDPEAWRWPLPAWRAEAVGTTFTARVIAAAGGRGRTISGVITVHSWSEVVYPDHRDPMEPLDGSRGHARLHLGGRYLALLGEDVAARDGWRLARVWEITDGRLRGGGLSIADGEVIDAAMTRLRVSYGAPAPGAPDTDAGVSP